MRISIDQFRLLSKRAVFCGVAAALAVLPAQAAGAAANSGASRVLTLDTSQIWARYVDPGLSKKAAEARKADLMKAMQPLLQQLSDQAGGAIVFDKTALLESANGGEIAPAVIASLDKSYVPLSSTPSGAGGKIQPLNPHMLVVSKDAVSKITEAEKIANSPQRFSQIVKQIAADNRLGFVLERDAVVLGAGDLDATSDAIYRLRGGRGRVPHPSAGRLVHILVINRNDILQQSKVGKSIVAQVNDLTDAAKAEFAQRANALQQDSQTLNDKLATLSPEEGDREVAAINARQAALQADAQARQQKIQDAILAARSKIEAVLGPILREMLDRRGVDLLVDNGVVLQAPSRFDVTAESIAQLDAKMPSVALDIPRVALTH
ncbi:MAG TPA: OmpH family outer membrane protein [Rhizomicrobium sp.]|nr:OmpH family outer membrane protein [Rhizomicrobium sp.]